MLGMTFGYKGVTLRGERKLWDSEVQHLRYKVLKKKITYSGLKRAVSLLPCPPECWNYGCEPIYPGTLVHSSLIDNKEFLSNGKV